MTINLNNALIIGTMSETVNDAGKHTFTRWADTHSKDFFLKVVQYLIDGIPDVSDFVIIDAESQTVLRFDGFVFDTLGMKSKRYSH